jgi:hypothetical protein
MAATLQIVDGHGGGTVMELNGASGSRAGWAKRGMNLSEAELAQRMDSMTQWNPAAAPTALGRRTITVPFVLVGAGVDDVGERVAKLHQATRGSWWLKVQRHGASSPCWLRCFGGVAQVGSQVTGSSIPHIAQGILTCQTDAYAIGARVDRAPTSVSQDPSAGGGSWGVDVDGVPGDTATPLLLRFHDSTALADPMGAFVSVRRRRTPSQLTGARLSRQAQSGSNTLTNGPGITMSVQADAGYSGGQYVRALFSAGYAGGGENAASITYAAPTLPEVEAPGVYRLFARVYRVGDANNQQLVLRAFTNNSLLTPDEIIVPAGGAQRRLVDLGLVQWPSGQPPMLASPVPSAANGAAPTAVTLQYWRKSSGEAQVNFDYMAWIPADEDAGYLDLDNALFNPGTQYVIVDGYQHLAGITSTDVVDGNYTMLGQAYGSSTPTASWTGRVPRVSPGDNRVFIVAGLSPNSEWPISRTLSVRMSYWPRWTWLR